MQPNHTSERKRTRAASPTRVEAIQERRTRSAAAAAHLVTTKHSACASLNHVSLSVELPCFPAAVRLRASPAANFAAIDGTGAPSQCRCPSSRCTLRCFRTRGHRCVGAAVSCHRHSREARSAPRRCVRLLRHRPEARLAAHLRLAANGLCRVHAPSQVPRRRLTPHSAQKPPKPLPPRPLHGFGPVCGIWTDPGSWVARVVSVRGRVCLGRC